MEVKKQVFVTRSLGYHMLLMVNMVYRGAAVKAAQVVEVPLSERWERDKVTDLLVTPWQWNVAEDVLPTVIMAPRPQVEPETAPPREPEYVPKRVYF